MTIWRKILFMALAAFAATTASILHYNLPHTEILQISGIDVKRTDHRKKGELITRDVRYISGSTIDKEVEVYRNEDTGWGWPPYFKFDSATLSAQAQMFAGDAEKPWVLVTYYGWRIEPLSLFPNAISLRKVDKEYWHLPIFNIIFLFAFSSGIFFVVYYVRKITSPSGSSATDT
jgi:hypothetical protein